MNDSDKTIISIPVKSLSRWHRVNKGHSIISVNQISFITGDAFSEANSVVYLKDGTALYVTEYPNEIDTLYKQAQNGHMEPLKKTEILPTSERLLSWQKIEESVDACSNNKKTDKTILRKLLGF